MTKTYNQKQMDSAKKRAYKKGYEAGSNEITMDEILDNAQQVKSWQKQEQCDFDWTLTLLVVACVGAILMMIF